MKKWIFVIATVLSLAACSSMESSDDKLKIATASMQRGDYQNAVNLAKQVLQDEPGNANARYLLGRIYYELGNYQPASKEFDKAVENGISNHEIHYLRFSALRRSLAFDELAKLLADNTVTGQLTESDMLSIQGWLKIGASDGEAAKGLFEASLAKDPNNLESLLGQVQYLIDNRKFSESLAAVESVLSKHPANSEANLMKATMLADQGDFVTSTGLLKELLAKEPKSAATRRGMTARFTLIQVLKRQDKHDEAGEIAKEAFRIMPENPQSLYYMGYEHFRNKNYTAAKDLLTKLINGMPSHNPALLLLGTINFEESNWEQASSYLTRFLADNPGNKQATKMLSVTQLQLKQADVALETLTPILDEGDFGILSLAGAASIASGDVDKGVDFLKSATQKDPENALIRIELAKAYFAQGEKNSAEKELLGAVSLPKGGDQALAMLSSFYVREKKSVTALDLVEKELQKHPESSFHLTLKGMLLVQTDKDDAALELFNQAIARDQKNWQAKLNLANLYQQQKKTDQADTLFKQLIDDHSTNAQVNMNYARFKLASGQTDSAIQQLEIAVLKNRDDIELSRMLANLYEQLGKKDKFEQQLAKMEENPKTRPLALHMRGQAQLKQRDAKAAINTYETFVSSYPDAPQGHYQLARAYMADKNTASAKAELSKAVKLNADYIPAIVLQAQMEISSKEYKSAKNIIDDLIKRQENNSIGYELMGDLNVAQNKHDLALKSYATAIKYVGDSAGVYLKHARSLEIESGKEKAITALENAAGKLSDGPRAIVQAELVKSYHKSADKTNVLKILTAMKASELNNPILLNDMAWFAHYYDLALAEELSGKAYALRDDLAAIKDTYGWILLKNGNKARALELLKSASESAPKSDEIHYHLAVAYFESDMKAAAKDLFVRINSTTENFEGKEQIDSYLKKLN